MKVLKDGRRKFLNGYIINLYWRQSFNRISIKKLISDIVFLLNKIHKHFLHIFMVQTFYIALKNNDENGDYPMH